MPIIVDPKFKNGDYIINRTCGDMAVVKGVTQKGYYTFSHYYNSMTKNMKDLVKYTYELQVNYDKFWDFCTEEEKMDLNEKIEKAKKE